ncbi:hypothetical protein Tco_0269719 [Tanacetum coccineum]
MMVWTPPLAAAAVLDKRREMWLHLRPKETTPLDDRNRISPVPDRKLGGWNNVAPLRFNNKQQGLKLDDRGFQIEEDFDELEYPQELFSASTSFAQGMVSNIPIGGSINFEGFLSSILLVVVIIVTVVIVMVILVVVIFAIVEVVIVVVVFGVVAVVVDGFEAVTFPSMLRGRPPIICFTRVSRVGTMFGHKSGDNTYSSEAFLNQSRCSICLLLSHRLGLCIPQDKAIFPVFMQGGSVRLLGLLALAMAAVCASTAVVRSAISCRMASKVMAGVSDVDVLLGGILSTEDNTYTYDELDNVVEEEDEEQIRFLGGNSSSGTKKYRGSNSNDGGNTGDGVKIAGGKDENTGGIILSVEFSEELKEMIPDEAGKIIREQRIAAYKGYRGGGVGLIWVKEAKMGAWVLFWDRHSVQVSFTDKIAIDRLRELVYCSYVDENSWVVIRGKGSKGKNTVEESQETVDVSKESEPEPEPAKKKTPGKRRVKKKVTLSADDDIISNDPDVALELAKFIIQTKAEEADKPARESALKSKPATLKTKLKGAPSLTLQEQEATDIMQALRERVPDESTIVSATSSEGTSTKPGVPDEEKDIIEEKVILEWGDEQDNEFLDDDVEKDDKYKEDDETESDEDEIYKYKIRVRKYEDVEIKDVEGEEYNKGEEKVTDAAKEKMKKIQKQRDDCQRTVLPSSSFAYMYLQVFGDQFLNFLLILSLYVLLRILQM